MPKLLSNLLEHTNKANKVVKFNEPPLISSYDGISGITPDSTVVTASMGGFYIKRIKGYVTTIECLKKKKGGLQ